MKAIHLAGLDQCCAGIGAVGVVEAVQRGQRACRGNFEDRATGASPAVTVASPARVGHPVEIPIGGLDEPSGVTLRPSSQSCVVWSACRLS